MFEFLVVFSALLQIVGVSIYIKHMFNGSAKPNRVTWLLWGAGPIIASAILFANGGGISALPVFMAGFAPLLVFIASFASKASYWKLTPFDYVCGFFSIVALSLWLLSNDVVLAVVFALVADIFATLPTVVKTWKSPKSESSFTYFCGAFNAIVSVVILTTFTFTSVVFPVWLLISNTLVLIAIYKNRFVKNGKKS